MRDEKIIEILKEWGKEGTKAFLFYQDKQRGTKALSKALSQLNALYKTDREKWLKSKQMSIDGIKDITEKFCTICANQDDVAFAIHKEQLKRLEGDNV